MNRMIAYSCMECGTSVVVDLEEYIDHNLFCRVCRPLELRCSNFCKEKYLGSQENGLEKIYNFF